MDATALPPDATLVDTNGQLLLGQSAPRTSRAFIRRKVRLHSLQAQKVFRRQYGALSTKLYQLSVVLGIITTEKGAEAVEAAVDEEFQGLIQEMEEETARMDLLLKDGDIDWTGVSFDSPMEVTAEITSPRAGRYLALLQRLDELVARINALWLAGMISDKQNRDGCYKMSRRVIKSGNRVIAITGRAMAAARSMAKQLGGTAAIAKIKERKLSPEMEAEAVRLISNSQSHEGGEEVEKLEAMSPQDEAAEDAKDNSLMDKLTRVLASEAKKTVGAEKKKKSADA